MKLKSEVERLYHVEGWAIQAIADRYGCSTNYIIQILGLEAIYGNELH